MPKRPREETPTYVKLELAGISRHGVREIHEVIERVLQQERDEASARRGGMTEETEDARDGGSTSGAAGSPPVALLFESNFVVDRVGAQSIPRDLQNPHTWEAWRVPTYESVVTASKSSHSGGHKDLETRSGAASLSLRTGKTARRQAPAGHMSRQARGRFHTYCPASRKKYIPGKLSPELRSALGMSNGNDNEDDHVPWLDRMRRYGYPPAFVIECLRGRLEKKAPLKILGGEEEEDEQGGDSTPLVVASESECVRKILEFPLYLCPGRSLMHPGFTALRQSAPIIASVEESRPDGGLLRVAPCPINC